MENNKLYSYLTKAAKDELELKTIEFKEQLLRNAYKSAERKQRDVKEISLTDILGSYKKDLSTLENSEHSIVLSKRIRWQRLITISGITYTILGVGLYMYQNGLIETKNSIGLIVAIVGIMFTLIAQYLKYPLIRISSNEDKSDFSSQSKYTIVDRWGTIEQLGRKIFEENFPNVNKQSFSSIINFLGKQLTKESYMDLRKLLDLRSRILHEDYRPTKSELDWSIKASDNIILQLEKLK